MSLMVLHCFILLQLGGMAQVQVAQLVRVPPSVPTFLSLLALKSSLMPWSISFMLRLALKPVKESILTLTLRPLGKTWAMIAKQTSSCSTEMWTNPFHYFLNQAEQSMQTAWYWWLCLGRCHQQRAALVPVSLPLTISGMKPGPGAFMKIMGSLQNLSVCVTHWGYNPELLLLQLQLWHWLFADLLLLFLDSVPSTLGLNISWSFMSLSCNSLGLVSIVWHLLPVFIK